MNIHFYFNSTLLQFKRHWYFSKLINNTIFFYISVKSIILSTILPLKFIYFQLTFFTSLFPPFLPFPLSPSSKQSMRVRANLHKQLEIIYVLK